MATLVFLSTGSPRCCAANARTGGAGGANMVPVFGRFKVRPPQRSDSQQQVPAGLVREEGARAEVHVDNPSGVTARPRRPNKMPRSGLSKILSKILVSGTNHRDKAAASARRKPKTHQSHSLSDDGSLRPHQRPSATGRVVQRLKTAAA